MNLLAVFRRTKQVGLETRILKKRISEFLESCGSVFFAEETNWESELKQRSDGRFTVSRRYFGWGPVPLEEYWGVGWSLRNEQTTFYLDLLDVNSEVVITLPLHVLHLPLMAQGGVFVLPPEPVLV